MTLIGSQMYVFGGYGGAGFARRDFNDVSVLDLETWEWRTVECRGEHPEPRSGHQVKCIFHLISFHLITVVLDIVEVTTKHIEAFLGDILEKYLINVE